MNSLYSLRILSECIIVVVHHESFIFDSNLHLEFTIWLANSLWVYFRIRVFIIDPQKSMQIQYEFIIKPPCSKKTDYELHSMKHHLSRQSLNSIYKLWTSLSAPWSHFESTLYFHKFTINPLSITRVDFYICFAKWSWIKKITIDWLFISRIHAESTVYFANTLNPLSVWRI